jgi:hypothetical protein
VMDSIRTKLNFTTMSIALFILPTSATPPLEFPFLVVYAMVR